MYYESITYTVIQSYTCIYYVICDVSMYVIYFYEIDFPRAKWTKTNAKRINRSVKKVDVDWLNNIPDDLIHYNKETQIVYYSKNLIPNHTSKSHLIC